LLRIEDVDAPRCSSAAATAMLSALEAHGFEWDGHPVWQSRRADAYAATLERLIAAGHVFACACTRRELADSAIAPDGAAIYPGTCRAGLPPGRAARAWRLRVGTARIAFDDAIQGRIESDLAREAGDFILRRADGLFAYQLAVVVDDAEACITHVVRGADLLLSTARQIHLQGCLGVAIPAYAHLPVAVNAAGEKLSKQTLAAPLDFAASGCVRGGGAGFSRPGAAGGSGGGRSSMRSGPGRGPTGGWLACRAARHSARWHNRRWTRRAAPCSLMMLPACAGYCRAIA
jgi:glutamyl-Q tRNA(Asp) synthetase